MENDNDGWEPFEYTITDESGSRKEIGYCKRDGAKLIFKDVYVPKSAMTLTLPFTVTTPPHE